MQGQTPPHEYIFYGSRRTFLFELCFGGSKSSQDICSRTSPFCMKYFRLNRFPVDCFLEAPHCPERTMARVKSAAHQDGAELQRVSCHHFASSSLSIQGNLSGEEKKFGCGCGPMPFDTSQGDELSSEISHLQRHVFGVFFDAGLRQTSLHRGAVQSGSYNESERWIPETSHLFGGGRVANALENGGEKNDRAHRMGISPSRAMRNLRVREGFVRYAVTWRESYLRVGAYV